MTDLKDIVKESLINEAKEEAYAVAFTNFVDKEGLPITTYIYVPREYAKDFQKYLEKEKDNTVAHAEGYTNDWELDD
jgi:hypothetical protein